MPIEGDEREMIDSERLARRYFSLFAAARVDELVEILHPDVELALKTKPGEVLRGPESVARYVADMQEQFYEAVAEVFTPVDSERIVVQGRIRWTDDDRVLRDDRIVLALQFRDGLLFRSIPAQTALEAESILATLRNGGVSQA